MNKKVFLSFDVEEFDMPLEYQYAISVEDQMSVGIKGLDAIQPVLNAVPATLFTGLRMPRMRPVLMKDVLEAGYKYDSSINPTWLPGRYNNFHLPRTAYREEGIIRIPAAVSPGIRIPLFWLSFKNMPYAVYKQLCLQTIAKDGYLCLYFHPWEFTYIEPFGLPAYTRRWCGPKLVERLMQLVNDLSNEADFETMNQFGFPVLIN